MRTMILAAVSALAMVAGAAHAEQANGYVGFEYNHLNADFGLGDGHANVYEGQGAVAMPLSGKFGGQLNLDVDHYDFGDGLNSQTTVAPTGHLFLRDDKGLVGAFVGYEHSDHASLWGAGGEGQIYLSDMVTLGGDAGYAQTTDLPGSAKLDFWAANGKLSLFPSENVRIDAKGGWLRASADGFGHLNTWNIGLGGEYQFKQVPVSLTAGYEFGETGEILGDKLTTNTFKVGVRWTFGGSLLQRDRKGAALDSVTQIYGGSLGQGVLGLASSALGSLGNLGLNF